MKSFHLTAEHIANGRLEAADFTAYAGYPVFVFPLTNMRHWETLKSGKTLSGQERAEREEDALNIIRQSDPGFLHMQSRDAWFIAFATGKAMMPTATEQVSIPAHKIPTYASLLQEPLSVTRLDAACPYEPLPPQGAFAQAQTIVQAHAPCVMPATHDASSVDAADGRLCRIRTLSAAMLDPDHTDVGEAAHWAGRVLIAPDQLTHHPQEALYHLLDQLHEMRHLKQLIPDRTSGSSARFGKQKPASDYELELDADLFAIKTFQEAGIGQETVKAQINWRYLAIFHSAHEYWFAPALETVLSGRLPPSPQKIYAATAEILCRVAMFDQAIDQTNIKSDHLQRSIAAWGAQNGRNDNALIATSHIDQLMNHYETKILPTFKEWETQYNPQATSVILPIVRLLVDEGRFTDPLSRDIALRTVEAGEYFSAGMTLGRAPSPHKRAGIQPAASPA